MIIYSPTFTGSVQLTGSQIVTGDFTVRGNLTAQQFILSSSVTFYTESFSSGSTRFGDSLDDTMTVTGSLRLTGSIGVGTALPTARLHISGTTGILLEADGVNAVNALVVSSSGNIGIGIATPENNLHISSTTGSLKVGSIGTTAGAPPFIEFVHAGNDAFRITGGSDLRFLTSAVTERMRITNGGNVGIGTSNPESVSNFNTLQVDGTSGAMLRTGTSAYGGYVATIATADVMVISNVRNPINGTFSNTGKAATAISLYSESANGYIIFGTSATNNTGQTERMRITSGGNVGIGITNPESLLHVASNVASANNSLLYLYNSDFTSTTRTFVRVRNNISVGSTYSSYFGQGADGKTYIIANDTSRNDIVIKGDNGYVGIGTNNPQVLFEVSDSSSNTIMVVRNASNASSTNKNAMYGFYGTDSDNSIKGVGGMQAVPNDFNWISGNLYWYVRSGDTQALRMSLSSGGALVISGALTQNGSPSDINLKENLVKISSPLEKISQINGYNFEWKEGSPARGNISNIVEDAGVIAQEIEEVMPEIVRVSDEHKVVNYNGLVALLIEGMKELKAEIEELKNK
jgi:hypothetical protein